MVDCENDGTERMTSTECTESCETQKNLYDVWTDTQLRDAFDDELSCLYTSKCDDIADGVCYDAEIWEF